VILCVCAPADPHTHKTTHSRRFNLRRYIRTGSLVVQSIIASPPCKILVLEKDTRFLDEVVAAVHEVFTPRGMESKACPEAHASRCLAAPAQAARFKTAVSAMAAPSSSVSRLNDSVQRFFSSEDS
jgi:hypothetical protein